MKSAAELSLLVRSKKKKMMDDPDVVDSGGSPREDLQDLFVAKQMEATDAMNKNHPKEHSEENDEMPHAESLAEEHEQSIHDMDNDLHREADPEDEAVLRRKGRISKMMGK